MYIERARKEFYKANLVMAGLGYDSTWALGMALNKTQEMVNSRDINSTGCENYTGGLVDLDRFNYSNALMGCVIRWNLQQTNFTGVMGQVQFDETGTIIQNRVRLLQYRRQGDSSRLDQVRFGVIDEDTSFTFMYENGEQDTTVFPDGTPPDGSPEEVIHTFHIGLTATYYLLATAGIVFAIVCLVFNFMFRKRKVIKMTSPNLNYFIIVGALLMLASVYVGVFPSTDEAVVHTQCILYVWLYITGYLMIFGTILAKMLRVYHIFHNPALTKDPLQDHHLVLVVLLVTGVGLVLVLVRSISHLEPPYLVKHKENKEGLTDLKVAEEYYIYECYSNSSATFYIDIVIYIYLILLQVVGLVLAFQTRKVKIPVMNDSKLVAVLIYTTSIVLVLVMWCVGLVLLRGHINIQATVFYGGILAMAAISLLLIFVPKMINLYRDPDGTKIFQKSNPSSSGRSGSIASAHATVDTSQHNGDNMIAELRKRIQDQDEIIKANNVMIRENSVLHRRIRELEDDIETKNLTIRGLQETIHNETSN